MRATSAVTLAFVLLLVADGIIAFSRLPYREVKGMARHAFMTTLRRETAAK